MLQPFGACGEAKLGRACGLFHIAGPFDQLIVGQRVNVCAIRQELQRLFVGSHNIAGLHPRDVLRVAGAQFRQIVESGACSTQTQLIQIDKVIRAHRREITMQRAEHTDGAGASLQFSVQTGEPRPAIVWLVIDSLPGEHLLSHRLSFFYGLGLRGPEQDFGLGGSCQCEHRCCRDCPCEFRAKIHDFLPLRIG